MKSIRNILLVATVIASCCCQAFTFPTTTTTRSTSSALHASKKFQELSRRKLLISTAVSGTVLLTRRKRANAAETKSLIDDLETSLEKLKPIPSLLEKQEWEAVRTILKTPPVNSLWNLAESKNTLQLLAKQTDNFDLIDVKDELALSLQMCDQLTYDNVFIYFQPGNGKVKVKEPIELANKAMSQLSEAINIAKSGAS